MDRLTWDDVVARLAGAGNYWLHTTGPDGAPNASPVWAVAVDGTFHFYTESHTVKARNLAVDPRVVLHLESAADVVIVHGELERVGRPRDHPEVVAAFEHKYARPEELPFLPSTDPAFDVLYALRPRRALVWSLPDTERSTRRWSRDGEHLQ